jgi:GAF domain-containing protein
MESYGRADQRAGLQSNAVEEVKGEALARLVELGSRLSRTRELKEGLQEILLAVIELMSSIKGNIQLLDRERGRLIIVAQHGFDRDFLNTFHEVSALDDTACGRALRLRRSIVIQDTENDAGYAPFRAAARAAGYRAVVSAPILAGGSLPLGMVSTHFRSPHQAPDPEKTSLSLYVRQAAEFIQRFEP